MPNRTRPATSTTFREFLSIATAPVLVLLLLSLCALLVAMASLYFPIPVLVWPALVLAAIGVSVWLVLRVSRQLELVAQLHHWAERMRGGDLDAKIDMPAPKHLADLIEDINSLGGMLKTLALQMDAQTRSQNVRLARKTQSLDILYDVALALSQPGPLETQLGDFLDTLIELIDAQAATVHLFAPDGKLRLAASREWPDHRSTAPALLVTRCDHCGWTPASGVHLLNEHLECMRTDPSNAAEQHGEVVVVPIQYQHRSLGIYALHLDRPMAALGEDALELFISVGRHLGLAIEKDRSDQDTRRLAVMEERNIIANELHDSLAQSLVSMRLQLKMLGENLFKREWRPAQNEARNLRIAVDEAHESLRALLANFRLKIDDRGLIHALQTLVVRFRQETGINVYFDNNCHDLSITPQQELQIFHIVQEALTNVRKHSQAINVRVLLHNDPMGGYVLLIEDDGLGITENEPGRPGEHVGLQIMRERAARVPGELIIESDAGEGTRVQLTFGRPDVTTPARATGA